MTTLKLNDIGRNLWVNGFLIGMLNIPFNVTSKDVVIGDDEIKNMLSQIIHCGVLIQHKKKTLARAMLDNLTISTNSIYHKLCDDADKNSTPKILLMTSLTAKLRSLNDTKEFSGSIDTVKLPTMEVTVSYNNLNSLLNGLSLRDLYTIAISIVIGG